MLVDRQEHLEQLGNRGYNYPSNLLQNNRSLQAFVFTKVLLLLQILQTLLTGYGHTSGTRHLYSATGFKIIAN